MAHSAFGLKWLRGEIERRTVRCTVCGCGRGRGRRLVAGNRGLVCEGCVEEAWARLDGWRMGEVVALVEGESCTRCTFCGRGREEVLGMVSWRTGASCGECTSIAREVLACHMAAGEHAVAQNRNTIAPA